MTSETSCQDLGWYHNHLRLDALNRLVSVTDRTNSSTYDDDGPTTVSKILNPTTTRYVREGGTIYSTLDGSGNVQSYNLYAGSLLASLDAAGARKVYHSDERGSVVAITDGAQNVVQSYCRRPLWENDRSLRQFA